MRMSALAAFAAAVVLANQASAQPVALSSTKTNDLARECSQSVDILSGDFCTGYILGVFDTLAINNQVCGAPDDLAERVLAVGRNYVRDHPEDWDKAPTFVLGKAFRNAFPCGRSQRR